VAAEYIYCSYQIKCCSISCKFSHFKNYYQGITTIYG